MKLHSPIKISQLSVDFIHKECFRNFSTTIYPREHIVLIGENGSGKSTLLSLLAGLAGRPYEGSIFIPSDVVVGYLPQDMQLEQNKTVWQVAVEGVANVVNDIHKLEAFVPEDKNSDEYVQLLEKLIDANAFLLENKIISLLQKFELIDKKNDAVFTLSGGQQLLLGLVRILAKEPNVLLLDEPTNHLDYDNRKMLLEFLNDWYGTAVVVSHDMELLRQWAKKVWDIRGGVVVQFDGGYEDYLRERKIAAEHQQDLFIRLQREKKNLIKLKEDERQYQVRSRKKGEKKYENAPRVVRNAKSEQAEKSMGKKTSELSKKQELIAEQLRNIDLQKTIVPTFDLNRVRQYGLVAIDNGTISYEDHMVLHDLSLTIQPGERVAFIGKNGSGKSTIFKALMSKNVIRTGEWRVPSLDSIGYIDQQYELLNYADTPFDLIKSIRSTWTNNEIRSFLNEFLFSKNEEAGASINTLSGGEKARLALACIVAQSPSLLLLDEITNNLDMVTYGHVVSVLRNFPGTLLVVSHDKFFLEEIGIERFFFVENGLVTERFTKYFL